MKLFVESFFDSNEGEIFKVLGNYYECLRSSGNFVFYKMKAIKAGIPNISDAPKLMNTCMSHALYCNNCPCLSRNDFAKVQHALSIASHSLKTFPLT